MWYTAVYRALHRFHGIHDSSHQRWQWTCLVFVFALAAVMLLCLRFGSVLWYGSVLSSRLRTTRITVALPAHCAQCRCSRRSHHGGGTSPFSGPLQLAPVQIARCSSLDAAVCDHPLCELCLTPFQGGGPVGLFAQASFACCLNARVGMHPHCRRSLGLAVRAYCMVFACDLTHETTVKSRLEWVLHSAS